MCYFDDGDGLGQGGVLWEVVVVVEGAEMMQHDSCDKNVYVMCCWTY